MAARVGVLRLLARGAADGWRVRGCAATAERLQCQSWASAGGVAHRLLNSSCASTAAPSAAAQAGQEGAAAGGDSSRKKLQNSLSYRAKQRGFLELDLLMGGWAEENLPTMTEAELKSFSEVLDQENPELFKWLTSQLPPSPEMAENAAFNKLHAHVTKFLDDNSAKATRSKLGKDWVRGWGDSGFGLPSSGNQQ